MELQTLYVSNDHSVVYILSSLSDVLILALNMVCYVMLCEGR
jgi:hypothetical protein